MTSENKNQGEKSPSPITLAPTVTEATPQAIRGRVTEAEALGHNMSREVLADMVKEQPELFDGIIAMAKGIARDEAEQRRMSAAGVITYSLLDSQLGADKFEGEYGHSSFDEQLPAEALPIVTKTTWEALQGYADEAQKEDHDITKEIWKHMLEKQAVLADEIAKLARNRGRDEKEQNNIIRTAAFTYKALTSQADADNLNNQYDAHPGNASA
jgi:hypothetical protein